MTVTAPGDLRPRSGRAVCDRSRAWWPGGDHRVAEGTYSELFPDVSRDAAGMRAGVPAVLLSRRDSQPRRARDRRLDP